MSILFIGLDGEMSAPDLDRGGRLIQAGAYTPDAGVFDALLGWDLTDGPTTDPGRAWWEERAAVVHRLGRDTIAAAPSPDVADAALERWLLDAGATADRRAVYCIGFNVGAFDLPHFRYALPTASALLSRRSIDLNALIYTLDGQVTYSGSRPNASGWKRLGKRYAADTLAAAGVVGVEHDAGYDAALAYHAWVFYRAAMAGTAPLL